MCENVIQHVAEPIADKECITSIILDANPINIYGISKNEAYMT